MNFLFLDIDNFLLKPITVTSCNHIINPIFNLMVFTCLESFQKQKKDVSTLWKFFGQRCCDQHLIKESHSRKLDNKLTDTVVILNRGKIDERQKIEENDD
jgi:hypothetical protein